MLMKKTVLTLITLLVAGLFSYAQTDAPFRHMAVGMSFGTGGIGGQLATSLGPHFVLRAGAMGFPKVTVSRDITAPEHPGAPKAERGRDVPVTVEMQSNFLNGELLLDLFPSMTSGFHFTVGAMAGPGDVIKLHNSTPLPPDYNTVGIDVDNYTVKARNNVIDGYFGVNSIRPYAGIGFGRAVRGDRRVKFTFDMGALLWGRPGLYAPAEPLVGDWEDIRIPSSSLDGYDEDWADNSGKIFLWPMINLHLFVRLF